MPGVRRRLWRRLWSVPTPPRARLAAWPRRPCSRLRFASVRQAPGPSPPRSRAAGSGDGAPVRDRDARERAPRVGAAVPRGVGVEGACVLVCRRRFRHPDRPGSGRKRIFGQGWRRCGERAAPRLAGPGAQRREAASGGGRSVGVPSGARAGSGGCREVTAGWAAPTRERRTSPTVPPACGGALGFRAGVRAVSGSELLGASRGSLPRADPSDLAVVFRRDRGMGRGSPGTGRHRFADASFAPPGRPRARRPVPARVWTLAAQPACLPEPRGSRQGSPRREPASRVGVLRARHRHGRVGPGPRRPRGRAEGLRVKARRPAPGGRRSTACEGEPRLSRAAARTRRCGPGRNRLAAAGDRGS